MPSVFDTASGSSRRSSAFDLPASNGKSSPFDLAPAKSSEASIPALEQEANQVGAPVPAQDSPGLFSRALDLISRPNYAVAGAAEELFSPQGGGGVAALKRAGTELFSGIGGLQGQKEGFGQVLEQAGVNDWGHFSDIAGALYNDTGEGWRFQRGGWADPTGRGAVGLGLDIAADPTTYLGFGVAGKTAKVEGKFLSTAGHARYTADVLKAVEGGVARDVAVDAAKANISAAIKGGATDLLDRGGIKWAGMHVADNPLKAIANSGLGQDVTRVLAATPPGKAVIASVAWTKKYLTDPVQQLLVKGFGVRGLEGARATMDDFLDKEAFLKFNASKELLEQSPLSKWAKLSQDAREKIFRPVVDAYQKGGLQAVEEEFRPAMEYYATKVKDMYAEEVRAGLIQPGRELENYFAHYYHNDVDELAQVIYKQNGGLAEFKDVVTKMLRLGRNAEERAYPTLADAERISKELNAQNKAIPVLKGVYDPIDSLTRRWEHSITKRNNRDMLKTLEKAHGPLPINEVYDLAIPVKRGAKAAAEQAKIDALLASRASAKNLARLTDDGKREFFRQRFLQIGDRAEAHAVLQEFDKYHEFFPKKLVNMDTDFAADGSRFMAFNPGTDSKFTAVLPESLAREVAGMADFVVTNKAARTLLQGFDTANNLWKGSVTWLFPAFHVRNAYSNVAQSFIDIGMHALNPASYEETARILFGKGEGTFKTALGHYSYDEVRQILNRHGINTSARAIAEFTGNESKLLKPFTKFREAGTAIENESRAQLALNYLRRGMDPEVIGQRVKKFQLDYANGLTNFERKWMKRIIPFYSFQRLNLGLQLDNLLHRPGMVAAELKPFRGRADENAQMTSWDAGALKLRLNRDGKNVQMITGIDLPIRNLDLLFRGNLKDTFANGVGMLTPIAKVPIEYAAGKSFFTGNDFDRAKVPVAGRIVEQMPVSVQKWLGYKKEFDKAGRPQYSLDAQRYYLLGQSFITSRFLSTGDRVWRQYIDNADGNSLQAVLDFTTGLRWQDMNMDEEMAKRADERKRDLEKALVRWGQRKQFERIYTPKGQR